MYLESFEVVFFMLMLYIAIRTESQQQKPTPDRNAVAKNLKGQSTDAKEKNDKKDISHLILSLQYLKKLSTHCKIF